MIPHARIIALSNHCVYLNRKCSSQSEAESIYTPLHGFTAMDLGYEKGNAISNFINRLDERPLTTTYLSLFDQIWNDAQKLEGITSRLCDHIGQPSPEPR
jgi:hypothetical protein